MAEGFVGFKSALLKFQFSKKLVFSVGMGVLGMGVLLALKVRSSAAFALPVSVPWASAIAPANSLTISKLSLFTSRKSTVTFPIKRGLVVP